MTAIIGYMIASVIIRYFLHGSIPYLTIVPNIFYVYVCLGAAYAYNQKAFMIVDVLYNLFKPRQRAVVDLFTSFFFFLFVLALLIVSGRYALEALAKFKFDLAILVDPVRWPTTIIFPFGPLLLLVAGAVKLVRNVLVLVGARQEAGSEEIAIEQEGIATR